MQQLNADNEFECIRDDILPVNLNVVAAGEHIGDIERANRSLKEGTRCEIHRCPYRWYPREMVKGCVIKVTKDNNDLPLNDGISDTHGPGTLVTGCNRPDYNDLKQLNFGDYVQVKQPMDATNTSKARTVGAIALCPSGNGQGSWYFMPVSTGERIHRYQWTELPLGQETIDRIHNMAKKQGMPSMEDFFYI